MNADYSFAVIERRVQSSIQPLVDECDRLLDHYLEDTPLEVWEPIVEHIRCYDYFHQHDQKRPDLW